VNAPDSSADPGATHAPQRDGDAWVVQCRLLLRGDPRQALGDLPYLGGLLHGLVRACWFHVLELGTQGQARLPFRVIAPAAKAVPWLDEEAGLGFQVLLSAQAAARLDRLLAALQSVGQVSDGAERYAVRAVQLAAHPLHWPQAEQLAPGTEPIQRVRIDWLTPLNLVSRRQIAAGFGHAPPSLHRIVRSLAQRAGLFAPQWASSLGIGSEHWVALDQTLRSAMRADESVQPLVWRYGSRTHAKPVFMQGLLGHQEFMAPLPGPARALLLAGQWLGVGEGASFGCGGYTLKLIAY